VNFYELSGTLLTVVQVACLALQLWAMIDCVTRRSAAFPAAGKLTKPAWLIITGLAAFLTYLLGPIGIFGIAGMVASIVYLVDVRPAIREITGGGR
jgi:hypothetical protein